VLNHIAIIMDGNRRWARHKKIDGVYGHKEGAKTLMNLCKIIRDKCSVSYVTIYAFSSENTSRSKEELDNLFNLLDEYLDSDIAKLQKENINVTIFGDFSIFKTTTQNKIHKINEHNVENHRYTLNIALNYGGRKELCNAFNILAKSGAKEITEEDITNALYLPHLPDVDLLIRTGGTQRLSNFLPWQAIYAELYFTPTLWPDFKEKHLMEAIEFYQSQQRNFGK
jgi:undecaprenyl diphosphate synthase